MLYLNREPLKAYLLSCFTFWIKSLILHNQRVEKEKFLSCLISDDLSQTSSSGRVNGTVRSWAHLGRILPPWRAGPASAGFWIPSGHAGRADSSRWLTRVRLLSPLCKHWNCKIRGKEKCREDWEMSTSLLDGLQHPNSPDDGGMVHVWGARGRTESNSTWRESACSV